MSATRVALDIGTLGVRGKSSLIETRLLNQAALGPPAVLTGESVRQLGKVEGGARGAGLWSGDPWSRLDEISTTLRACAEPRMGPAGQTEVVISTPAEFESDFAFRAEEALRELWPDQRVACVPEPVVVLHALAKQVGIDSIGSRLVIIDCGALGCRFTAGIVSQGSDLKWDGTPQTHVHAEGGLAQDIRVARALYGAEWPRKVVEVASLRRAACATYLKPWKDFLATNPDFTRGVLGDWIQRFHRYLAGRDKEESGEMRTLGEGVPAAHERLKAYVGDQESGFLRLFIDALKALQVNSTEIEDVVLIGGGCRWYFIEGWLRCFVPPHRIHTFKRPGSILVDELAGLEEVEAAQPAPAKLQDPSADLRLELQIRIGNTTQTVPLTTNIHFGRQPGAAHAEPGEVIFALPAADYTASRRHAVLRLQSGQIEIEDLSRNGTLVNGKPIVGACALRPGDRIQMGTTLMFLLQRGKLSP